MDYKLITQIAIIVIVSILLLFIFSSYVPFHMAEFVPYHAIGCSYYPLNALNTFSKSCTVVDLAPITGHYLPLRSFKYIGSFPSLIYFPLFKLWPSPYSARLLGLAMLAIQAFLLRAIFKTNLPVSFILLLICMPYSFQHIADEGPIAIHTTSIFLLYFLIQRWLISIEIGHKQSWKFSFLIGLVIFLGIWTKISYFFLLPGVFIYICYCIMKNRSIFSSRVKSKLLIKDSMLLLTIALTPSFLLLNSTDRDGHKYYEWIANAQNINLKGLLEHFWDKLAVYIFNPLASAHQIFDVGGGIFTVAGAAFLITVLAMIIYGIKQLCSRKINTEFIFLNIFLSFMTIFLISACPKSDSMHHIVLAYPFIILSLFYIFSKLPNNKVLLILIAVFIWVNITLFFSLAKLGGINDHCVNCKYYEHKSKLVLNNLLNKRFGDKYVLVNIDWGLYYLKSLYGVRNQCVLFISPFDGPDKVMALKEILIKTKRKAVFIMVKNTEGVFSLIQSNFPDIIELQTDFNSGPYRIWYEP